MVELRQGLIDALLQRPHNVRTTMLEVALIDGVNDSLTEAEEMSEFAAVIFEKIPGSKLIVNLIPFNDIGQEQQPGYRSRVLLESKPINGTCGHAESTPTSERLAATMTAPPAGN